MFFKDVKKENLERRNFSAGAPDYRIVTQGLNIEARHVEFRTSCKAKGNTYWQMKGLGSFDLLYEFNNVECPLCNKKTPKDYIINLGFNNCDFIVIFRYKNES